MTVRWSERPERLSEIGGGAAAVAARQADSGAHRVLWSDRVQEARRWVYRHHKFSMPPGRCEDLVAVYLLERHKRCEECEDARLRGISSDKLLGMCDTSGWQPRPIWDREFVECEMRRCHILTARNKEFRERWTGPTRPPKRRRQVCSDGGVL